MIQGKVGGEEVILARQGGEFVAIAAKCSHYGGPLGKGLIVADEVRCRLHHACFSLRTGAVMRPPAFDPIPCWRVERVGARVFVHDRLPTPVRAPAEVFTKRSKAPASVVIVGGGAAGLAAADGLRSEGYDGPVTILSADDSAPYDRPNLSKDYLAGAASDEWMPLRSAEYYSDRRIELALNTRAMSLPRCRGSCESE
jgi:3-phenylpropionate/trans-cinnamate dioxygenase ferredoxin reductase subunit